MVQQSLTRKINSSIFVRLRYSVGLLRTLMTSYISGNRFAGLDDEDNSDVEEGVKAVKKAPKKTDDKKPATAANKAADKKTPAAKDATKAGR